MNNYVTAETIRLLREKRGFTQKQLAERLLVSDKTVSKWETARGLPDISLIEPLARELGVSVAELLSGEYAVNRNRSANMLRSLFYVCPICGNVIHSTGHGSFSCCGVTLPPLEAEAADGEHIISVQHIENELYVTLRHEMSKEHHISFIAAVTDERISLIKLYPEQEAAAYLPSMRCGVIYAFCNRHGLFSKKL